eukprot:6490511-Amphidinium_carterae.2
MDVEPEPQPQCVVDTPRLEPCLVDTQLARQLAVFAPVRAYVVWSLPGADKGDTYWSGLHFGENSWQGIQQRLCEGRYLSGRDRLRRLVAEPGENLVSVGEALFQAEARKHGVRRQSFRIWVWPSSAALQPPVREGPPLTQAADQPLRQGPDTVASQPSSESSVRGTASQ